jgi:DNA-binding IscR family transcriptional regulator
VESRRGAEGGYMLARPASLITIGEVYRFFDGGQKLKSRARRRADSAFEDLWRQVDEAVASVVDHTTFADLLRSWTEKHNRFVPNWEI